MVTLLQIVVFLGVVCGLAFFRAKRLVWIPTTFATLLLLTFLNGFSILLILFWLLTLSSSIIFAVTPLRQQWLTRPAWHLLRKRLPPLSETERVALAAGDVWWEGELFNGSPQWQKLFNYPITTLTDEEKNFIAQQVETLCSMLNDWEIIQQRDLPSDVWNYIKQEKFWGIAIPKEHGGLGFSAVAHSTIISKIASRSLSAAVSVMVPNSLGPAELIYHYGTATQKTYYLPRLAKGEEIPCFALTGLEIGSDAGNLPDTGIVCYDDFQGEKTLGIRLNWDKRYITLAPIATLVGLAFKLYDPEHLLGDIQDMGITLALIPANHPGVKIGQRHSPLGLAFPNGPIYGNDVFIPLDWIIGGKAMAGQGWRMLMECLSIGRGISLPSLSTGFSKLCYRMTGAYARIRKQFKVSIGSFEGVAERLARIGGFTYIIEATRLLTASAVDLKTKPAVASAIAKYHLTEMARHVVNDAMDIHAGRGIQTGPRNYLSASYQGIPISITVEGANILTRNLMIFGQGAIRCHHYLRHEMALLSAEDNVQTQDQFDKILLEHIGSGIHHLAKTFVLGLTGGKFSTSPVKDRYADYYRQLNRMSAALAFVSDITLLSLGGDLKRKEFLSARLGDVLSHLFLASAVLKYNSLQSPLPEEENFVIWSLQYCLSQIQIAFDHFFDNFPQRYLAKILRFMVFPWGRAYTAPHDDISKKIAEVMLSPNALRERLTTNCYNNADPHDVTGRMEHALQLSIVADTIERKIKQAIQAGEIKRVTPFATQLKLALEADIIDADEATLLQQYEHARIEAIQVDVF